MSWFRRNGRATSSAPAPAEAQRATLQHFGDFARTRPGVEAYIEPATHVTQTTLILIAATGEWTRRRVARTRPGVEAYIEPATHVTQTTLILIAATGEWTRRRVPNAGIARQVAQSLRIPVYDVNLTGYPRQMREWNAEQRTRRPRA